jgi:hypothetical protein
MHDLYDEAYGSALAGRDWPQTVAGRFLKAWERRALAAGWRAGRRDLDEFRRDMERMDDVQTRGAIALGLPW